MGDPPVLFAKVKKAKEVLGLQTQFNLQQIITGALSWEEHLPGFLRNG
jgi:UDP-glucose 4-epimerase